MNRAEFVRQRMSRDLSQSTCKLHASGATADDDERQQPTLGLPITFSFGAFKGEQDPSANGQRVLHGLESRRVDRPLVVPVVGRPRPCRHNQIVVVEATVAEHDGLPLDVNGSRLGQPDPNVALTAKDPPNRRGDVTG